MNERCTVIIFAKAPLPGLAKTRLAPLLGNEGAARLASRMLAETLAVAVKADVGPVELCCAPDASHPQFMQAAKDYQITLTAQGEGDLGERMHRALARSLNAYGRAIVIGTDAPGLRAEHLRNAASSLLTHPAVFVPAMDGGYVLVGLSQPVSSLFSDIAWSTAQVMAQTRQRMRKLGIHGAELQALHDIDEPDDVIHLPKEWLE